MSWKLTFPRRAPDETAALAGTWTAARETPRQRTQLSHIQTSELESPGGGSPCSVRSVCGWRFVR